MHQPQPNFHRRLLATACAALCALPPPPAAAGPAWENGRAYTAMLEVGVAEAAEVAVGHLQTAMEVAEAAVVAANAALFAARSAAAAAPAGAATTAALAAITTAQGAVAAAEAAVVAAGTGLAVTTVVATGAVVGTYIGQGLRGLWDVAWGLISSATSTQPPGAIYASATPAEMQALLPTLITLGSGFNVVSADFDAAGTPGLVSRDFILQGAHLSLGAARGAAAANAGHYAEALLAVADLQAELVAYRNTVALFADVLATTVVASPAAALATARTAFDTAVADARANCPAATAAACTDMHAALDQATTSLQSAAQAVGTAGFPAALVGGSQPVFEDLSLARFQAFLDSTALQGAAALPAAEVALADGLMQAAGVTFPGMSGLASAIAAYDALGDTGGAEGALFNPSTGTINLAELLRGSATVLSANGAWLNINLEDSPVTQAVRAAVPEPSSLLLVALALAALLRSTRRAAGQPPRRGRVRSTAGCVLSGHAAVSGSAARVGLVVPGDWPARPTA